MDSVLKWLILIIQRLASHHNWVDFRQQFNGAIRTCPTASYDGVRRRSRLKTFIIFFIKIFIIGDWKQLIDLLFYSFTQFFYLCPYAPCFWPNVHWLGLVSLVWLVLILGWAMGWQFSATIKLNKTKSPLSNWYYTRTLISAIRNILSRVNFLFCITFINFWRFCLTIQFGYRTKTYSVCY